MYLDITRFDCRDNMNSFALKYLDYPDWYFVMLKDVKICISFSKKKKKKKKKKVFIL